jgi:hypothetical protein
MIDINSNQYSLKLISLVECHLKDSNRVIVAAGCQ